MHLKLQGNQKAKKKTIFTRFLFLELKGMFLSDLCASLKKHAANKT